MLRFAAQRQGMLMCVCLSCRPLSLSDAFSLSSFVKRGLVTWMHAITGDLVVTVAGQTSTPYPYSYIDLVRSPVVFSTSTLSGPLEGGTLVAMNGSGFGGQPCVAVVTFVGLDTSNGQVSAPCPIVGQCTDSYLECMSPAVDGSQQLWSIRVVVDSVPFSYGPRWQYDSPVVMDISPGISEPVPLVGNDTLVVHGKNFGTVAGAVTVGGRAAILRSWNHTVVVCTMPPGVVREAAVVVTAASGATSSRNRTVSYLAPVVSTLSSVVVGTSGGVPLVISGRHFCAPLPMSVWLVRPTGLETPWASGMDPASWTYADSDATTRSQPSGLLCPGSTANSTVVVCMVPEGAGAGWHVVVVNHDDLTEEGQPSSPSPSRHRWQASAPSPEHVVSFARPTVTAFGVTRHWGPGSTAASVVATAVEGNGSRPAVGGFTVVVVGSNFGPVTPNVTICGTPCALMVPSSREPTPPPVRSHAHVVCIAPPKVLGSPCNLSVAVEDAQSEPLHFEYDGPEITDVQPAEYDALGVTQRPPLVVRGSRWSCALFSTSLSCVMSRPVCI